ELLALHASSYHTSNTMALWSQVKRRLDGACAVTEIGLRNGVLVDCSGCPFNMCLHFGENDSCFYGGVMTDDVYPALREADAVLMICPNYNDAISANLTAFINRLTAMYRKRPFSDKALFAIVVSGYSGSDIVLSQLIAALNMNKSFFLPPYFALYATANDPGSVMKITDIGSQIASFASVIQQTLGA
ncbi:MAG: NAD(P)H-dependent oxidoreductase, partial [Lachnospiraceae bacterium]|nr:NAD(P)H-dependent oxidoreductase [Lachnospiraceae bacterium]